MPRVQQRRTGNVMLEIMPTVYRAGSVGIVREMYRPSPKVTFVQCTVPTVRLQRWKSTHVIRLAPARHARESQRSWVLHQVVHPERFGMKAATTSGVAKNSLLDICACHVLRTTSGNHNHHPANRAPKEERLRGAMFQSYQFCCCLVETKEER